MVKGWEPATLGVLVWRNVRSGEFVSVSGNSDARYWVVRRTFPRGVTGQITGAVYTQDLSPYYVERREPVGRTATDILDDVKNTRNWKWGTKGDALNFVTAYMQRNP
jgi:hypothetical protein